MADWLDKHPVYDPNAPAPVAPQATAAGADDWLSKHPLVEDQPVDPHPDMSESDKYMANAVTGMHNIQGAVLGLPHSIAVLGDYVTSKLPYTAKEMTPGWLTRHTISPAEWNAIPMMDADAYGAITAAGGDPFKVGVPNYKPETTLGRIGQSVISTAPVAAIGGGGVIPFAGRELANAAGISAVEGTRDVLPDSPGAQMAAGLLASVLTPRVVGRPLGAAANTAGKIWGSEKKVQQTAENRVLHGEPATSPADEMMQELVTHSVGRGVGSVLGGVLGAAAGPTFLPGLGELAPFAGFGVGSGAGFGAGNFIPNRLSSFENRVQDAMTKVPLPQPPAGVPGGIRFTGDINDPVAVQRYINQVAGRATPTPTPPPQPTLWDYIGDRLAGYGAPQTQVFPGQ